MSESRGDIIGDKNSLAQKHMGLVHSCCKHFTGKGVEYEELFSAGCLGLAKAVERFDESRGLKFSTYAVPVILGEIKRIFRDGGSVRVSRTLKELSMKICRLNTEYEKNNGREMSVTELSQALNVSEDKICEALSAGSYPLSLNADYDDEGNSRIDIPVISLAGSSKPSSKNGSACIAARVPSLVSIIFLPVLSCVVSGCPSLAQSLW